MKISHYEGPLTAVPMDGVGTLAGFHVNIDGVDYASTASSPEHADEAADDLRRHVGLMEQIRQYRRLENRRKPILDEIAFCLSLIEKQDGPERVVA